MRSQYFKKTPSSTTETVWNWITGTDIKDELRVRTYEAQSTQTTDLSPNDRQVPSTSRNSIVTASVEHSASLFGSTESIHQPVTNKSSPEKSNSTTDTKSTHTSGSISIEKKSDRIVTKKSQELTLGSITTSSSKSKSSSPYKRSTISKASSLHKLTRLSSQTEQSKKWCSGTNLCIFLTIIGCCVVSAGVMFSSLSDFKWRDGAKGNKLVSSSLDDIVPGKDVQIKDDIQNVIKDGPFNKITLNVQFVHGNSSYGVNYHPNPEKNSFEMVVPKEVSSKEIVYWLTIDVIGGKEYYVIKKDEIAKCQIPTDDVSFRPNGDNFLSEIKPTKYCPDFKAIKEISFIKERN